MGNEGAIGAVLAGGRSTRMGTAKAMVELGGRPLLEHTVTAVEEASLEVVIVAKPDSPLPAVGHRVVRETAEPTHPLHGVVAALAESDGRPVVAVACDMPLVPPGLVQHLARVEAPVAVVEAAGRMHPLLARFEPTVSSALADAVAREAPAHEAVRELDPRVIADDELAQFGDPELVCLNINTPADLERAEAVIGATRRA